MIHAQYPHQGAYASSLLSCHSPRSNFKYMRPTSYTLINLREDLLQLINNLTLGEMVKTKRRIMIGQHLHALWRYAPYSTTANTEGLGRCGGWSKCCITHLSRLRRPATLSSGLFQQLAV